MLYFLRFSLAVVLLCGGGFLYAQCNLAVDAGTDILVCSDDGAVRLDGTVPDEALSFSWSPADDLSAPNSLIPLVFLNDLTLPATFTLTAVGFDPDDNIIANGDFENGDSDFTTEYDPGSGGSFGLLSDEGEYAISTNTNLTHNNFGNCTDHTGGGQMMVVNGSDEAGQEVWCQFVDVTAGTDYLFNAWAMAVVNDNNDAELQFSIDGALLGSEFPVSGGVCQWEPFNAPYTATTTGMVEICIVNQNTATGGNDFALDDIFFGEICSSSDEVTIDEITVEAVAPTPVELPCSGEIDLEGTGSTTGDDVFFNWTAPGGGMSAGNGVPFITATQAGDYVLEVFYDDGTNFCSDDLIVTVTDDEPAAVAVATDFSANGIDCNDPQIQLSGAGSSVGPDWTYSWSTPDGNIVSGANTLTPTIDAGGTYEIVVFNPVSGCTAIEVITIDENLDPPFASIATPPGIPCGGGSILLDGTLSDSGPNFSYEWTTVGGSIVSGGEGLTPEVSGPGTYQLIVGRGDNGCTDTASVTVVQEANDLEINFSAPDSLNCGPASVDLDAGNSSTGPDITYTWTTTDGNIVSGGDGSSPSVNAPGTYVLLLEDTETGCSVRDSLTVFANTTPPPYTVAPTDSVTCRRDSALISVTGTAAGSTFSWATQNGEIRSGQGTATLIVGTAGNYTLTITSPTTGCSADTTVRVGATLEEPVADAGPAVSFTCGTSEAMLDGSNSSSGPDFTYVWTTNNGSFVSGAGTQVPVINAIGDYFLEVTNSATGCTARDTVRIESDDQAPPVSIIPPGNLDCNNDFRQLDATASASGTGFVFAWTTVGGNFTGGQNTLTPTVDAGGTYTLTVTDTINNCTGEQSVIVENRMTPPAISVRDDFRLDCNRPTDTLSSAGSAATVMIDYNWTTTDGNFAGPTNVQNPLVDRAGTYVLTLLNNQTGCFSVDSIVVTADLTVPTAEAGTPGAINCQTEELTLGDNAQDPDLAYNWTTADGSIVSGTTASQLTVDSSGNYVLLVTDPDNGCSATDSVTVTFDQTVPTVVIATPAELNCDVGTFNLDAGGSSAGGAFDLQWTASDGGNLTGGATTATPTINAPGDYTLVITNTDNFCVDSARVTVTGNVAFPTAEAGDDDLINCSDETTTLSLAGSDEGPGFTYFWTTNDGNFVGDGSGPNPEVDSAGVYFLTIRDETNNCTTTDSVVITADFVRPVADAGPNRTLDCNTTELTVGILPAGGLSYFWSSNNGSAVSSTNQAQLTVNGPGLYSLTVRDLNNGCRSVDNVSVAIDTVAPLLFVPQPEELNCQRTEATLSGTSDDASVFSWTTADGVLTGSDSTAQAIAGAAGTYLLTATDTTNGCQNTTAVTVVQDTAAPVLNLAPAAALTCVETESELSAGTVNAGFSYAWTTSDGNILTGGNAANATVDSAGTYVLTVTDNDNFCTTTDSLTVARNADEPSLSIAPPEELTCVNNELDLTAATDLDPATAQLEWTTGSGTFAGGTTTLAPTVTAAGVYQLVVTNPANGCSTTATTTVAENRMLPVIELAAEVDLGCTEDDFTLSASATGQGNLTYTWATTDGSILNGSTEATPLINGPGTYAVTVTDDRNGCQATAEVFADQNLLLDFDFSERLPGCDRPTGTIQFGDADGGTGPFSYSIDGGNTFGTDPIFQGLQPDNYVLVIRDANGCEVEDVTSIAAAPDLQLEVNPNAQIDFGESFRINAQINFPLSEIDTIIWTPARGLDCTDCLDPRATPLETQGYRIRVETVDGCIAEEFLTIIVNEENPVFFPTAFSPNGDGVNDTFVPFASLTRVARIRSMNITDRWGENVFLGEDFAPNDVLAGWDGTLNGKLLNPQVLVYSVEVEFINGDTRIYKGDFTLMR